MRKGAGPLLKQTSQQPLRYPDSSMDSSQNFNLKWAEFQSNLKVCYSQLEKTSDFSDVTLVGEGGNQIKAHRVILAATSPIFEDILMKNDHPKPLIYMRGIKGSHLKLLMSYIYQGEVEVSTEDLKDFLAVADELKVKGLTTDGSPDTNMEKQANDQNGDETHPEHGTYPEEPALHGAGDTHDDGHAITEKDVVLVKQEDYDDSSFHDEMQDVLGKVETELDPEYACDLCGKLSNTKLGLVKHKSRYHSEAKKVEDINAAFECQICGMKSVSKGGLHKHNIRHHSNV